MSKVYTFREAIAINLPTGETHYMNPKTAREIARALNAHAKSVARGEWADETKIKGKVASSSETARHGLKAINYDK